MSELLPCPFCGGTDLSTSLGSRVECRSCGAGGPVVITKDARIEWNRRAALPCWIPVEEGLPEEGLCVLLACEYADAPVVGYQKHGMWWADTEHHEVSCGAYCYGGKVTGCLTDSRITHWMPLPAPPTQEEQE